MAIEIDTVAFSDNTNADGVRAIRVGRNYVDNQGNNVDLNTVVNSLPDVGAEYLSTGAYLVDRDANKVEPHNVEVSLLYQNTVPAGFNGDLSTLPASVSLNIRTRERRYWINNDGSDIMNTNGMPIIAEQMPTKMFPETELRWSKWFDTVNYDYFEGLAGKCNTNSVTISGKTYDAKTLLVVGSSAATEWRNNVLYARISLIMWVYAPDQLSTNWSDVKILAQGYFEKDGTDIKLITDFEGNPLPTPTPLNSAGAALDIDGTPHYIDADRAEDTNMSHDWS